MDLAAIVVVAENGAIGKDGDLLCHLPADLKHFKNITMGHTIIMGRRMARRQFHRRHIGHIPRTHHYASRVGIVLD